MLIRSILDVRAEDIDWVFRRADLHRERSATPIIGNARVVSLAFLEPSLRTRAGFAAAAGRLGLSLVEVQAVRSSESAMPESIDDTLRTLAGYSSLVVARVPEALTTTADDTGTPILNGGDRGPGAEHPSQALIDLYAMLQLGQPLECTGIAICGDPRMRAVTSLLRLLAQRAPRRLVVISEPELLADFEVPRQLSGVTEYRTLADIGDVDVLYVAGIPHGALREEGRTRLRVTSETLDRLKSGAVVLSPLPVVDEIDRAAIRRPSVRVFVQSDDGLLVRMALMELILGRAHDYYSLPSAQGTASASEQGTVHV